MNDFRPCPGKITNYHAPGGLGVRVDTHVYSVVIPPYYDSMIAKLIVVAQTRDEAIEKMKRALRELQLKGLRRLFHFICS